MHILISRTDAIGDVVLTLPMCGLIKAHYPSSQISFLGNSYTREIVQTSKHVDHFLNLDHWSGLSDSAVTNLLVGLNIDAVIHVFPHKRVAKVSKKAGIKLRVGTRNRIFHWVTCNRLVKLSRRNSELHEAQLNVKLLKSIGVDKDYSIAELPAFYGFTEVSSLTEDQQALLSKNKFNLLIHPKSRGNGQEWSLDRYAELINSFDEDRYKIFITGSEKESALLGPWIKRFGSRVTDVTGKFSLAEFISFISIADGLLASGTGPVHLAAALGRYSLGLYPPTRPIHAGRWGPVGLKAFALSSHDADLGTILASDVKEVIDGWRKE